METQKTPEPVRDADLEVNDTAFFRDVLKAVSKVNMEPRLTIDPEGITVKSLSRDERTLIDLYIPRGFFWGYEVYEERTICFNVDNVLKQVFKPGKMKDITIRMRIETERIIFDTVRGGKHTRKTVPLLDVYEEETADPEICFKSSVEIMTGSLIKALDDCKIIDGTYSVLVTVEPEQISFNSVNYTDYVAENAYDKYADEILNFSTVSTQKAYYNVEDILTLVKALKPISEGVRLELSTDMPIRIGVEFPTNGGYLIYHLAPEPHENMEPITEEITEPVLVDIEDPGAEEITEEDPEPVHVEDPEPEPVHVEEIIPAEAPVPHEDQLSLGELYLKYLNEALARNRAEAA